MWVEKSVFLGRIKPSVRCSHKPHVSRATVGCSVNDVVSLNIALLANFINRARSSVPPAGVYVCICNMYMYVCGFVHAA